LADGATGGLEVNPASIPQASAPEPPISFLIGVGLAGIGMVGRFRRASL